MLTAVRTCVFVAVAFAIAAGLVDALVPDVVPAPAREAFLTVLKSRPPATGAVVVALATVYWLALAAAVVGMVRGARWGFAVGVVVTLITVVQAIVIAPHAYSGLAFSISYVSKIAWGAALALSWARLREPARS